MPETPEHWVVLELGPKAEKEDPDVIRASIRHSIRDAEVFIPASVIQIGGEKVVQYLMEGYAFIRKDHPDSLYFKLENTKYVQGVLRQPSNSTNGRVSRQVAFISGAEINRFRSQIRVEVDQGIEVGDTVLITSGAYRQITARVEEEIPEQDAVQVYIKLRSKEALITLPRACLRLMQKAPKVPGFDKLNSIKSWLLGANTLLAWPNDAITRIVLPYDTFVRLQAWAASRASLTSFVDSAELILSSDLDARPLEFRIAEFEKLVAWAELRDSFDRFVQKSNIQLDPEPVKQKLTEYQKLNRGSRLWSLWTSGQRDSDPVKSKYVEWLYLGDVLNRLDAIRSSVDTIEQKLLDEVVVPHNEDAVQNVILDGTQLLIRCLTAPGLNTLKDAQGRPTGAIIGFLQSLSKYRKRFTNAHLHVTWDGSSQRRRKMFAGYKADRPPRFPAQFEYEWLQETLPMLGVSQSFHPDEEADDVIATLVRGPLAEQMNIIVSTDRDLIQLVSTTTHQLAPAMGAGKEKMFDPDAVLQEYDVPPDEVLVVRALSGDTSDRIPGAVGIGLKTASKLVKLYGTVDRILDSNLSQLSKSQSANLRSAEKQIRLNVELMRLHTDLSLTTRSPNPDQIRARARLQDVDIKPDAILTSLLGSD